MKNIFKKILKKVGTKLKYISNIGGNIAKMGGMKVKSLKDHMRKPGGMR